MDERLEKALEFSNFMVTIDNQKRALREKFYQDVMMYINGGQFLITKELISFCSAMLVKCQKTIVLIDDNDMPIEIDDLQEFFDSVIEKYTLATNSYFKDYKVLRSKRSVEFVIS